MTKIRWVVEAVHGIIGKKFKLLHNVFDNKLLHSAKSYIRIACFLNNEFGRRLNSDWGMEQAIAERMLSRRNVENLVQKRVETEKLSRRTRPFARLTSGELTDFPELTEDQLKLLFTGTYQLSQAISYLAELLDEKTNTLKVDFLKEDPLPSTFVRYVKFIVCIKYKMS